MIEPRLKAGLFVRGYLRICEVAGVYGAIVRKGDETAGSVLIRISRLDGTGHVLAPVTHDGGGRAWRYRNGEEPQPDAELDAMIEREVRRDPDLWLIEIEDKQGRHFLDEPVIS